MTILLLLSSLALGLLLWSRRGSALDRAARELREARTQPGKRLRLASPDRPVEELLARLRAMTRQSVQLSSRLTFGSLCLDQTTFELSTPSGSFRLANKEYQMMELFLRNPRQIIPTERFLERIWGYDSEVEVSVVWVYISYLRKKLAALQADVEIRASRNLGYALEVRA